jgi:hypothetical protein
MVNIGLIEGRHAMPVDGYLLPANITESCGYGSALAQAAYNAVRQLHAEKGNFNLYLTGLTVAAVGATSGLLSVGITHFYSYDPVNQVYCRVEIL